MNLRRIFGAVAALSALACAAPAAAGIDIYNNPYIRPSGIIDDTGAQSCISANPCYATDKTNAAYTTATSITVGAADIAAARGLSMACTVAGNVSIKLSGTSAYVVPVNVGLTILPVAAVGVNTSGTTATCTYVNLS